MSAGDWIPSALLIVLALIFAGHAQPRDRQQALAVWYLLAFDWLLYISSWSPYNLHFALKAIGIPILSEDIWPIVDASAATLVIVIGYDRIWAWFIWFCFIAQECVHVAHQIRNASFGPYTHYLDLLFWAQIGCFLYIGGPGVMNHVGDISADIHAGLRLLWRAGIPAQARSAER